MVIALPDVPGSGSYTDCWTYYGSNHTRSNNHNDEIIDLAKKLISRSALNIDPKQVYITGFSAGGAQANVIAMILTIVFSPEPLKSVGMALIKVVAEVIYRVAIGPVLSILPTIPAIIKRPLDVLLMRTLAGPLLCKRQWRGAEIYWAMVDNNRIRNKQRLF